MAEKWADLEKYEGSVFRKTGEFVSIQEKGVLIFNSGLTRKLQKKGIILERVQYISIHYSVSNLAIVLKPTTEADGTLKLSIRDNMTLCAKSFFTFYGLNLVKLQGRYKVELLEIPRLGLCLVIFLNKKIGTLKK